MLTLQQFNRQLAAVEANTDYALNKHTINRKTHSSLCISNCSSFLNSCDEGISNKVEQY